MTYHWNLVAGTPDGRTNGKRLVVFDNTIYAVIEDYLYKLNSAENAWEIIDPVNKVNDIIVFNSILYATAYHSLYKLNSTKNGFDIIDTVGNETYFGILGIYLNRLFICSIGSEYGYNGKLYKLNTLGTALIFVCNPPVENGEFSFLIEFEGDLYAGHATWYYLYKLNGTESGWTLISSSTYSLATIHDGRLYFNCTEWPNAGLYRLKIDKSDVEPVITGSQVNLAMSGNGLSAVMSDLNKIDSHYGLIGWYSHKGGYKISAYRWEKI
jgi:hypothetical protein